jgi:homoaconitase/3-isopropylmalate dehydratase large subunit
MARPKKLKPTATVKTDEPDVAAPVKVADAVPVVEAPQNPAKMKKVKLCNGATVEIEADAKLLSSREYEDNIAYVVETPSMVFKRHLMKEK